jgi:hypothetical protein
MQKEFGAVRLRQAIVTRRAATRDKRGAGATGAR